MSIDGNRKIKNPIESFLAKTLGNKFALINPFLSPFFTILNYRSMRESVTDNKVLSYLFITATIFYFFVSFIVALIDFYKKLKKKGH